MSMRFPGQRRPPGQSPAHLAGAAYSDLAVLPPLTLVGDRGRHVLRVLDGCAPFGSGCDELVSLLADACAPVDPLELRGESEALAAFRAANGRARDRLPVAGSGRRVAARRASRRPPRPPARRSDSGRLGADWSGAGSSGAAPLLGSALAVAASTVVMIFAYAGSLAVAPLETGHPPAAIRPAVADHQRAVGGATGGGAVVAEPGRTPSGGPAGSSSGSGPTGRRDLASSSGVDSASAPVAPGQLAAGQPPRAAGSWPSAGSPSGPAESPTGSPAESGTGASGTPSAGAGSSVPPGMAHGEHGANLGGPVPGGVIPGKGPRAGQTPGQNSGGNPGQGSARGPNSGKVVGKTDGITTGTAPEGLTVNPAPVPVPSAGVAPTAAPSWPFASSNLESGIGVSGVLAPEPADPQLVVDLQVPGM